MRTILISLLLMWSCMTQGQSNPVPFITQPLVPDAVAPGTEQIQLKVRGAGFVAGSVVKWNSTSLATTFLTSDRVSATVPGTLLKRKGTISITMLNPGPGGGVSNVASFSVRGPSNTVAYSRTDLAVEMSPQVAAIADFNLDGKPDLAVAETGSNTVSVLLGNGDGTFQGLADYASDSQPQAPIVGDFNHDGKLDMAVPSYALNTVSVFLGNGDGTFQQAVRYVTGAAPAYGLAVDLNRDGVLDLVTVNQGTNTISVLFGNRDGSFKATSTIPSTMTPTGSTLAISTATGIWISPCLTSDLEQSRFFWGLAPVPSSPRSAIWWGAVREVS